jgi:hypothetical protein
MLPGASADWPIVLADRTALADLRYTLRTDQGDLIYVQSSGVRHGRPEVLDRLGRDDKANPSEYAFRTATRMPDRAPPVASPPTAAALGLTNGATPLPPCVRVVRSRACASLLRSAALPGLRFCHPLRLLETCWRLGRRRLPQSPDSHESRLPTYRGAYKGFTGSLGT